MASTPVSTVAFLRSDGGAGWDEYEGVLHGASSEIRLLRHGSLVRSFALSKGTDVDGPVPTKDGLKQILFVRQGKNFLEMALPNEEVAHTWIAALKPYTGGKGILGSGLAAMRKNNSTAVVNLFRKSANKVGLGKDSKESKNRGSSGETSPDSTPGSTSKRHKHSRSASGSMSINLKSFKTSDDRAEATPIPMASALSSSDLGAYTGKPTMPTAPSRVKVAVAAPEMPLELEFDDVEDVSDYSASSDDDEESMDVAVLSARFRQVPGASESETVEKGSMSEELTASSGKKSGRTTPIKSATSVEDLSELAEEKESDAAALNKSSKRSRREKSSRQLDVGKIESESEKKDENEGNMKEESTREKRAKHLSRRRSQKLSSGVISKAKEDGEVDEKKPVSRRVRIVTEVLTTERSFVAGMQLALSAYHDPLLAKAGEIGEEPERLGKIFGNLRIICGFNEKLLVEIEKAVSAWTDESTFGPVFLKMAPFLKMYTAYSNRFEESISLYQTLLRKNERFAALVRDQHAASGSTLSLPDLLIMPIQRIPRYSLLLKDLISNTPESALAIISEVASHVNEEVRRAENQRRVEEIQQKGVSLGKLIAPHRFLIKEGIVKATAEPSALQLLARPDAKTKSETFQFFLFNDVFVHIKKSEAKVESDLTSPLYYWPLIVCWLTVDSGRKAFLRAPWETLSFNDVDGWASALGDAVKNSVEHANKKPSYKESRACDDHVRYGVFEFPFNNGVYNGRWLDGVREGRGTFATDQCSYRGEFKANKYDGKGRMDFFNGDFYVGQWSEGSPHGRGKHVKADGSEFVGNFSKGARKGLGRQKYANGDVYEGQWKSDRMHGKGRYTSEAGLVYEGEWKDNRFEGLGKLQLPSGLIYYGDFRDSVQTGRGTIVYPSGLRYVGDLKDNMRHGQGVLSSEKGIVYEGDWEMDVFHGHGSKTYASGAVYTGSFVNGDRVGRGTCAYPSGAIYVGAWEYDRPHGLYGEPSGFMYQGQWQRGKCESKGTVWLPNGSTFIGHFLNGVFHKNGVYTGGPGDNIASYDGDWLLGRMHGKGVLVFASGDSYKGQFVHGAPHGDGTFTFANGIALQGSFSHQCAYGSVTMTFGDRTSLSGQVFGNTLHRERTFAYLLPPMVSLVALPFNDVESIRAIDLQQ